MSPASTIQIEGGAEIRAVLVGLRAGTQFQLAAVDEAGAHYAVVSGTAAGGPQTILGQTDLMLGDIEFVVVTGLDGTVLLSVQVSAKASPR